MRSIQQLVNLKGRKALVTGGSGHIGRMACETLTELGASVAVLDLDAKGPLAFPCDLLDEKIIRKTAQTILEKLGGLDILLHCAGYVGTTKTPGWVTPFEEQNVEAWDKALRVNLTSAFILVQELKKALETSGYGSVIFFSSIYGVVGPDPTMYEGTPMVSPAGYGASKGGLLQLTRYLATELAPHVRVNAISPGGVLRGQPEIFQNRYIQRTPLKRMAVEEDLKGAVAFLASDLSQYVTGQNLIVDGGWTTL